MDKIDHECFLRLYCSIWLGVVYFYQEEYKSGYSHHRWCGRAHCRICNSAHRPDCLYRFGCFRRCCNRCNCRLFAAQTKEYINNVYIGYCAAFHHFESPELFLKEVKRVLKRGGALYIAELNMKQPLCALFNLVWPLLKSGDVKIYRPKELNAMLARNGFSGVESVLKDNMQIVIGKKNEQELENE